MFPSAYAIGTHSLHGVDPMDTDPRGLCWVWEKPSPTATYVMGIDPTVGITNWHRSLRTQDDSKTDNAAIEVLRINPNPTLADVQVCEYAAPIDPEDLADVANILGRLYSGNNEDGQCLSIIEIYPGPGLLTLRRMIDRHGYTNQFIWSYLDHMSAKKTASLGWTATPKSVRDLWIRGSKHINQEKLRIWSPWLIEEMTDAEMDPIKMSAKASYGQHDDRLRAALLSLWAGHSWTMQIETEKLPVIEGEKAPSWQASDISADKMYAAWEDRWAELSET